MAEMSNPVDVMGRELPYSQEAELAVIGSALTNSHSVAESVEILRPSDFYFPQNKEIFSVILDLFNENAAIDFITVSNKLSQSDKLEAVGGIAYLRNAATNVPTTRHVTYYSQIIKEKAVLRTLIKSAGDISEEELVKLIASVESVLSPQMDKKIRPSIVDNGRRPQVIYFFMTLLLCICVLMLLTVQHL